MSFGGVLLALSGAAICADPEGPTAAIQQALKRQQFYNGEITGRNDEETRAAVRRFQIRNGLRVTGELNSETLEAVAEGEKALDANGQTGAPAAEPEPPRVPARERARTLAQSDKELLEQLETDGRTPGGPQNAPARAPQPAPRQPAEGATTSTEPVAEAPGDRAARATRPVAPQPREPRITEERPPAPERAPGREDRARRTEPAERRETEDVPPPAPSESRRALSESEVKRAVEGYLAAAERPSPEQEISFYADQVNYFTEGRVSRRFIEKDQRNYYRRWPQRNFTLLDEPEVVRATEDAVTVRFRIRYDLKSGNEAAHGKTEEIVRWQRTDDGLKIVGIRERKLD